MNKNDQMTEKNQKILVIEDTPLNLKLIKSLLEVAFNTTVFP